MLGKPGPRQSGPQLKTTLARHMRRSPTQFDSAWDAACLSAKQRGSVSAELTSLMRRLFAEAFRHPIDCAALRNALDDTLVFLCSRNGRTDANVHAVGSFMETELEQERDWKDVPDEVFAVLCGMWTGMYASVEDPRWAEHYGETPEQLLELLRGRAG